MAEKQIAVSVAGPEGAVATFVGTLTVTDPPVKPTITSVTVTPVAAPPGTRRTITINAIDPRGAGYQLTYTCTVDGVAATPVAGTPGVFFIDA